jgi:molecular chaperone GrpE (heat shock protein)
MEIEQKEADAQKKQQLKNQIQRMQQETDKLDTYDQVQASSKEIEKIIKEMDAMDDKKNMKDGFDKIMRAVDQMEATPSIAKDIQQNGLQASISSGVQVPGTFTPQKGLFQ